MPCSRSGHSKPLPAPPHDLMKFPAAIEHQDRRRGHRGLIGLQRPRAAQYPYVVLRIDADAGRISQLPLRRHLRPGRVHLEHRHAARLLGSLRGPRRVGGPLSRATRGNHSRHQNSTTQELELHVLTPVLMGSEPTPLIHYCFLSVAFKKRSVRSQPSAAASLSRLPRSNECPADGYKRNS